MAIKTLRVFQEFTSEGYVPMPPSGNIDYGVTIAGTFPEETPTTYQLDDPDIDVEVTEMTDFYVWIRSHGSEWNINYTRNVRVYPDSPLINNVVMGIIIANLDYTVPYVGATENVDLGEFGLSGGFLHLDNTPTLANVPTTPGTLVWNDADGTADLKLKGGNVTLQLGQEQVVRVVNKTGATLNESDFRAVRIRSVAEGGAQGQRLAVVLAQGDNDPDSATTIGLVTESILNNEEGFITTSGEVKKIDTTGAKSYGGTETWVDGDVLYLSPTHPGYLTKVKPQAPDHTIIIGWVVYAHANNGKIFVKVDNGYELDELHNVKITNPLLDDFLMYDTTLNVWKNKDMHGTKGYIPYYNDTTLFLNSPFWTDGGLIGVNTITPRSLMDLKGTTAYTKLIVDNNGATGGGMFSAYQNGAETAMFGADAHYQTNTSIDAAIVAKKAGGGIQFYTNGSQSEKMGINSDGNVFVGQTPTYVAGATQLVVRGKTGAGFLGVNHYDMSIKGFMNTFNSVFQVGTSTFHSLAFLVEDSERGRVNSSGRLLWGTTTDNGTDLVQINGSLIASSIKRSGGTSSQYLMADGSVSTGTSLTPSAPLDITGGVISISQSSATTNGYLSSTDWSTFNAKQSPLSGTGFVKVNGTTVSYDNTAYTPTSRLLTINGTSYDLSADRTWTITPGSGMRNVTSYFATSGQTTFTVTGGYTVGLVDVYINGVRLTSADYTATNGTTIVLGVGAVVNDIVDVVSFTASLTSGVTGSGTSNYIAKWTGSGTIANSQIFDNGSVVGIGTTSPNTLFSVKANTSFSSVMDIQNASASGYSAIDFYTNTGTYIGSMGGSSSHTNLSLDSYLGGISFKISGSEKMRLATNGSVGIGTSTPNTYDPSANNLVVYEAGNAGITIATGATNFGSLFFARETGTAGAYRGYIEYGQSADYMAFGTVSAERMRITSSGNVGIGTASPSYKLSIIGGNASTLLLDNNNSQYVQLMFQRNSTANTGFDFLLDGTNGTINMRGLAAYPIIFSTSQTAGAPLERMRITSGGNVGIGTTSPSNKLHIYGSGTNGGNMRIQTVTGNDAVLILQDQTREFYLGTSGGNFYLYDNNAASNRFIVNASGDALFGKTSNNWQVSGMQIADLGRNIGITSNINVENLFLHKLNQTGNFIFFLYNSGGVGSISTNGSSTSFNTTSDYRLKTDFKPLNGLAKIKDINVYDFQWKSTGERMDGMIAHELQDILPYAVSGVKDGKDMQMVDYSKIVPVLVQAIKELNAKLEAK